MVPDNKHIYQKYISIVHTIINILKQLKKKSSDKQHIILSQKWDQLIEITKQQNELLDYLDNNQQKLHQMRCDFRNQEIERLNKKLKQYIDQYRAIENTNIKMLNDSLYLARLKVEKLYPKKGSKKTYTKNLKKDSNLLNDNPALFNKII